MSVFILLYEAMYTIKDITESLTEETRIITHLFSKIPFAKEGILQYRPNEDQRSLKELLEYMLMMGHSLSVVAVQGTYDKDTLKPFAAHVQEISLKDDFVDEMKKQTEAVNERLTSLTEEQLEESIDPFGGGPEKRKSMILNVLLKTYTAYRMQLFLYLKDSGERQLNTANVWQGRDR